MLNTLYSTRHIPYTRGYMIERNTPFQPYDFAVFLHTKMKDEGYTVKKIVDASGIAVKHIESLLESNFKDLPPAPYLHGYIYTLGTILRFDPEPWWNTIKEELTIQKSGRKDSMPLNRFAQTYPIKKIVIISTGILVLLILIWRLPKIFGTPTIIVADPTQQTTTTFDQTYTIRGKIENANDTVTINNEKIAVDKDGFWQKTVLLQSGVNTFTVKAKKLLGKETEETRQIIYENMNATTTMPLSGNTKNTSTTINSSTTKQNASSSATSTKKR